jgi:parallel beta-helix repeat protein
VVHQITPGPDLQKKTQEVFIKVKPGEVIEFAEGKFPYTMTLSLTVDGVTIRGKGMDKSILSFKGQTAGTQGILANETDGVTFEDLAVEDAAKDCIKVLGGKGVVFRRVRAAWTGGAKETNGAYSLYPVQCSDVLIEDCVVVGSADAGVYVGQSKNIIVRRCKAEMNVAGIEIENSTDADVYDNIATNNAAGLLVFDLPDHPVRNGGRVRAFKNQLFANNHPNFAPKGGAIVSTVPPGCGMIVLAANDVEVFDNDFKDNDNTHLSIISYLTVNRPFKDKEFDPFCEGISVFGNRFEGGGKNPVGDFAALTLPFLGKPFPDIVYDGILDPKKLVNGKPSPDHRLIVKDNGTATFANVKLGELDPKNPKLNPDRDLKNYAGDRPRLPAIKLAAAK